MAPPTQLTITMIPNSIANSISIPISVGLQNFETAGMGSAGGEAIRAIFKAGVFVDGTGRWWAAYQILSITVS